MLNKSTTTHHEYLKRKGFPLLKGYVLDGDLLIPMRIDDKLVGLQQIKPDGTKKFLFGQWGTLLTTMMIYLLTTFE